MKKKISQSIQAKTFFRMLALLVACCATFYGMVIFFWPHDLLIDREDEVAENFQALEQTLQQNDWQTCKDDLLEFAVRNRARVNIIDDSGKNVFSLDHYDTEGLGPSAPTAGFGATFWQKNHPYYLVVQAVSASAAPQPYEVLLELTPLLAVLMLLISVTGAYLTARSYSRPLVEISVAAQRMATLDLSSRCAVDRQDEIGTLAQSLNEMSAQLQGALAGLQAANAQLQQDIEHERAQEKQRIEFFTAVSHELKTPIAIIKGQLEGMIWQVGEYKDRDTYLRQCLQTTNRMEALVREILAAARMGGSDFRPARADLNLSEMLRAVCGQFCGPAEDKRLALRLDIAPGVRYQGDRRLIEKVFTNVVGNAVAYSPPGAAVTVRLQGGVFTVENTGVHIAAADLPHLFTPFYRVEKSRNRNSGGSGLGLYIVKTILDHHGAACRIENTADGVRFTAELK